MPDKLPRERLLAIIELQNEIAASALHPETVMELVVHRARELLGAAAGVIELLEGEDMVYHHASGTAVDYLGLRLRADASLSGLCVARGEVLHCVDARSDGRVDSDACERVGAVSALVAPLRHGEAVVGVLKVYDPRPNYFGAADVTTLTLLSGVVASHMAHARDYSEQRFASEHDVLTGLPNRRAFDQRLAAEAARLRRHGGDVGLCLIDLDRFKAVNDTLGHAAGDEVLRAIARHLDDLRGEDAAYRVGGDEFALLLVGTGASGARLVYERVSAAVEADPACHGVGVSCGFTMVLPDPAMTLARADEALYAAKTHSGD